MLGDGRGTLLVSTLVCLLLLPAGRLAAQTRLASLEFAEIQAALDACPRLGDHGQHSPSQGCLIELPCGQNQIRATPKADELGIYGRENVHIRGCGMNGTRLTWSVDSENSSLLRIMNSRWVTITDVMLEAVDGPGSGSNEVKVVTVRASRDLTFERVHFHAASAFGPTIYPTAIRLGDSGSIDSQGSPTVTTIGIRDSRIHSTATGLELGVCDDCWVEGTWFGAIESDIPQQNLIEKRLGTGVRLTNNTFDFSGDDRMTGVRLYRTAPGDSEQGATAQVLGNSFIGMRQGHIAILLYGYDHAQISQNLFRCATPGSCSQGVRFRMEAQRESRENLIVDNIFKDFSSHGNECPIKLQRGRNNIVSRNVFHLSAGSDPVGVCVQTDRNHVATDNYVFTDP